MVVRGAPAIGVTGALSLAVDLVANKGAGSAFASLAEAESYIVETLDYLVTRCAQPNLENCACLHGQVAAAWQAWYHPFLTWSSHAPPLSRPTAVNLADSAIKLKAVARSAASTAGATPATVSEAVIAASEGFMAEDIAANRVRGWDWMEEDEGHGNGEMDYEKGEGDL